MALVDSIQARVITGSQGIVISGKVSPPGTDGDVFLGIGGREFRLDTTADDFENFSDRTYILGSGANVNNPLINDPRIHHAALWKTFVHLHQENRTLWKKVDSKHKKIA